jgi:hypothetical protein
MMKISLLWRSVKRWLRNAGREFDRFLGPLQPCEPGPNVTMSQAADFRFHASYGRSVFRLHAPAPRTDSHSRIDVHDAFEGSPGKPE